MNLNIKTDIPFAIGALLALIGTVASFYLNFLSSDDIRPKEISLSEWKTIQAELETSKNEMILLRESIKKVESPESVNLLSRIETLESSYKSLNSLFLTDQQRAVTLPLIKGEISQQSERIEFVTSELDSVNSSVQWLIALVFTSFAALIGVIVTLLMRDRSTNNQKQVNA